MCKQQTIKTYIKKFQEKEEDQELKKEEISKQKYNIFDQTDYFEPNELPPPSSGEEDGGQTRRLNTSFNDMAKNLPFINSPEKNKKDPFKHYLAFIALIKFAEFNLKKISDHELILKSALRMDNLIQVQCQDFFSIDSWHLISLEQYKTWFKQHFDFTELAEQSQQAISNTQYTAKSTLGLFYSELSEHRKILQLFTDLPQNIIEKNIQQRFVRGAKGTLQINLYQAYLTKVSEMYGRTYLPEQHWKSFLTFAYQLEKCNPLPTNKGWTPKPVFTKTESKKTDPRVLQLPGFKPEFLLPNNKCSEEINAQKRDWLDQNKIC